MRATRRGWAVAAVVGFSLVMAWLYGPRALNAIVAPLVVAGVAAIVTLARVDEPTVERLPIEDGFVGESRTVTLEIDVGVPVAATVNDDVPEGVIATGNETETTLSEGGSYAYEIELDERGEHVLGPVSIATTDVLGLVERRFECHRTQQVLAYPRIYDLRGGARHELRLLADAVRENDREEFDHLREYERGDPLRDVHWKSAAKRADGELIVKEFAAAEDVGRAEIAAKSTPSRADEMAAATASVATYLLERGVAVGVAAPSGSRPAKSGREQHRALLRLLATTDSGELSEAERQDADVLIRSDANGTAVVVDDHEIPFERLRGDGVENAFAGSVPRSDGRADPSEVSA